MKQAKMLAGIPHQLYDDTEWMMDLTKHGHYFEMCCGCGLCHKTYVRRIKNKLYFRHERMDGPPTAGQVDNSNILNTPTNRKAK